MPGLRSSSTIRLRSLARGRSDRRRGGVAAELAMVLPILCLITFGSMQVANTIHFKQALTCAAFEGTRMASGETADRDKMIQRIQAILDARKVINAKITITPGGDLRELPPGTPVTISITAPISGNVKGPNFVQFSSSITATGRTVH
ncbi:MAG: TadE/TadG family type IV pilus assembly protein [Planctomycetaceae bacterium]